MDAELTTEQSERFNQLYQKGWDLIQGHILVAGAPPAGMPGWFARRRLRRAIDLLQQAVAIYPGSWQSLYAIGKAHQRLGAHDAAVDAFARAHQLEPSQTDVAREAAIEAAEAGRGPQAVMFAQAAVRNSPQDAGLRSNLAVAQIINGELAAARESIAAARAAAPADPIAQFVESRLSEIQGGRRPQPRTVEELLSR